MNEQILALYHEGMTVQNIALKLGQRLEDVLKVLAGYADDWRDKRYFTIMEERLLTSSFLERGGF